MVDSIRELSEAIEILEDESRVLELAAHALWEACPRGTALTATSRGDRALSIGAIRTCRNGIVDTLSIPHDVFVKTPAFDMANVPVGQRNRWVEPFREGIATPEGFRRSAMYALVRHFNVFDQGRVAVCSAERQVALAVLGVPEDAPFTDEERERLAARALELVVPLRASAVLANARRKTTAIEAALEAADDSVIAIDADGTIIGTSRSAVLLLRTERDLPDVIRRVVREGRRPHRVSTENATLHFSPSADGWLVALDAFVEPPRELTARQEELLVYLAKGLTNAEIGTAMSISSATVKTMLERMYRLAGVSNRVELLTWARSR